VELKKRKKKGLLIHHVFGDGQWLHSSQTVSCAPWWFYRTTVSPTKKRSARREQNTGKVKDRHQSSWGTIGPENRPHGVKSDCEPKKTGGKKAKKNELICLFVKSLPPAIYVPFVAGRREKKKKKPKSYIREIREGKRFEACRSDR